MELHVIRSTSAVTGTDRGPDQDLTFWSLYCCHLQWRGAIKNKPDISHLNLNWLLKRF